MDVLLTNLKYGINRNVLKAGCERCCFIPSYPQPYPQQLTKVAETENR